MLDSDDYLSPNSIEILRTYIIKYNSDIIKYNHVNVNQYKNYTIRKLETNKFYGLVDKNRGIFDMNDNKISDSKYTPHEILLDNYDNILRPSKTDKKLKLISNLFIWNCIFKRDLLDRALKLFNVNYDVNIFIHEDNFFNFLISIYSEKLLFIPEVIYHYDDDGESGKYVSGKYIDIESVQYIFNSLYMIKYINEIVSNKPDIAINGQKFIDRIKKYTFYYTFENEEYIKLYNEYLKLVENNQI